MTAFKKPTIKENGRAYVRLFQCFPNTESWLNFLANHSIKSETYGSRYDADCEIRVINRATGDLAVLGLEIPNRIRYHTFGGDRSFWNEWYLSATHTRHRTTELGYNSPSKDETVPR
ncbi:hypothetical protein AWB80_07527 [Caballeronia pedi]|uniref:Uncharacterized protein n=1 Tax=Caballeronia pedi TaxID=1777141 RepID=A0A158DV41_9BURK|nr:hypothetical protein [Caballeronia pedi]SAK98465.1 hypothetical protein AWB80_07527 [Caballeronia pedi]